MTAPTIGPKPGGPTHPTPNAPRPRLADLLAEADELAGQLHALIRRASGLAHDPAAIAAEDATCPGYVAARLMSAAADVQSARRMLDQVAAFTETTGRAAGEGLSPGHVPAFRGAVHGSGREFRGSRPQAINYGPAPARAACSSVASAEAPEQTPRLVRSGAGAHL